MKPLLTFLFLAISAVVFSQAPQSIPYQAVIRNTDGSTMANAAVTITFKIHDNSATGTVVYEETHNNNTNAQGLVSLNVGGGTAVTGTFSGIQWGTRSKFLQVLMNAGNGIVDLGTQQLMSVPYALYAEDVNVRVSVTGDSLFIGDQVSIVPGVSAANPVPFFTEGSGTIDIQGNSYSTILVGQQEWMEGYLKSDFFNNGEKIDMHDLGQCYSNWGSYSLDTIIPMIADYWLDNGQRAAQDSLFGHYYSLGALVNTKNICPVNWKVPSSSDIKVLMKSIKNDFDSALSVMSLNQDQINLFWNELNWKISQESYSGNYNTFDYSNLAYNFDNSVLTAPLIITTLINTPQSVASWILADGKVLALETIMDHWQLRIINLIDLGLSLYDHEYYFATKCILDSTRVQYGCTNPNACNFHNWAQEDDGSCFAPGQNCDDKNGNSYNDVILSDCSCQGIIDTLPGVIGCLDVSIMIEGCDGMSSIEYFGEVYDLVELGGQCWFAEDLKTIFDRDSIDLNNINNSQCIDIQKSSVFIDYDSPQVLNNSQFNAFAYNQSVVIKDNVCPIGWHLPTECEWKYMLGSLGATVEELNSNSIGCQNNINGNFRMFNSYAPGLGDNTISNEKTGFNGIRNTAGVVGTSFFSRFTNGLESYWWLGSNKVLMSYQGARPLFVKNISINSDPNNTDFDEVNSLRCIKGMKQTYGCKDVSACNYNFDASTEDGSCLHVGDICNDSALQTLNDLINNACECVGQLVLDTIINPGNGVQDIDGNHYSTVIIGNQEWMAENLKTTRYNNGDAINHVEKVSNCLWTMISDIDSVGSYLIYNNQSEKNALYGKLYNKSVVEDDRNVCPTGWVVPGFQEWNQLLVYLDPQAQFTYVPNSLGNLYDWYSLTAGSKLKSTQSWMTPASHGNSGFSALASGKFEDPYSWNNAFGGIGTLSYWWVKGNNNPSYFYLTDNSSAVYFGQYFNGAFSIRCVKAQ
jgi:uncharacterized protein (TIGR02145 family)